MTEKGRKKECYRKKRMPKHDRNVSPRPIAIAKIKALWYPNITQNNMENAA